MIPKGLFSQLLMLCVSVAIVLTFIQPKLSEIGEVQDSINVYQKQRDEIVTVNSQLAVLVSEFENISPDDKARLINYMPDEVDTLAVVRDLFLISKQANVLYVDSEYAGLVGRDRRNDQSESNDMSPVAHQFNLSVEGTYRQIKDLLSLMQVNDYPLEIQKITLNNEQSGFLSVDISLNTFSFNNSLVN